MSEVTELSRSIVDAVAGQISCRGEVIPLSQLADLYKAIQSNGSTPIHKSVRDVLLRLTETHVLSHPKLGRLIALWDGIVGTAYERIEGHLREILGTDPHPRFVAHVYRCLSSSAARRGRSSGEHQHQFMAVLEKIAEDSRNPDLELRCICCGYHFRIRDLSPDKVRTAIDLGLKLATSFFPGRNEDPFKPIVSRNGDSVTRLTIDHVIPEETLGWSDADNLAVMCQFCNQGKLAFYRPLEALSTFAIGGLANVPPDRSWSALKAQIVVAALRSQSGTCSICGSSRSQVELTVRPLDHVADGSLCGFAPWNLRTICYKCLQNASAGDDDLGLVGEAVSHATHAAALAPSDLRSG